MFVLCLCLFLLPRPFYGPMRWTCSVYVFFSCVFKFSSSREAAAVAASVAPQHFQKSSPPRNARFSRKTFSCCPFNLGFRVLSLLMFARDLSSVLLLFRAANHWICSDDCHLTVSSGLTFLLYSTVTWFCLDLFHKIIIHVWFSQNVLSTFCSYSLYGEGRKHPLSPPPVQLVCTA